MKLNLDCQFIIVFFVVISGILPYATSSSATRIMGDISVTTFTKGGNPYLVLEDIYIPEKGNVVIPAGVVLLFSNLTGFKVMGTLSVEGTDDDPVIFSSVYDADYKPDAPHLANPDDWNGIFITPQVKKVIFRNFKVKFSTFGITSKCPDIVIENGRFIKNTKNIEVESHQFSPIKDNDPFSNQLLVASSDTSKSDANLPNNTDSIININDTSGNAVTNVTSLQTIALTDSIIKKTRNDPAVTLSRLFNYNNHDNDILILRKRLRLSLMSAMALGGTVSWIANHVQTANHFDKMNEYSKISRDPTVIPEEKFKAEANYTSEKNLREKSIQRVNVSAGMTIALCVGIGLTLAF